MAVSPVLFMMMYLHALVILRFGMLSNMFKWLRISCLTSLLILLSLVSGITLFLNAQQKNEKFEMYLLSVADHFLCFVGYIRESAYCRFIHGNNPFHELSWHSRLSEHNFSIATSAGSVLCSVCILRLACGWALLKVTALTFSTVSALEPNVNWYLISLYL